ncbi:aspartate kinase [Fulvivirgaceae bacterium BMA12]|uniref:Aspartokinase n=1 Tax=Agaribacillus aureus TaxID=3051825 RepID=A0ABT8LET3_9BACT|nr:aspartate kinase [Fulvivirgaceae bacterium BMA12]
MKVLKFGGTSVGKPQRMHHVASLITSDDSPKLVVLSAISGTTNTLVNIDQALAEGKAEIAQQLIDDLYQHYQQFLQELYQEPDALQKGKSVVDDHFGLLKRLQGQDYQPEFEKEILAQGELLSTKLFTIYLKAKGVAVSLLPALDFMAIDANHEPVIEVIEKKLKALLSADEGSGLFITQGYICRNHEGNIDNLKRGGSDYSASLIGAAIKAEEVQIWTDIDGMHNNDPRIVEKTFPVSRLSFDEAAELSYFGAKILHPASIWPAQKFNIPVRLLNTMQPEAAGTFISQDTSEDEIKAIAAKDGIVAIKIKSSRMLLAYGFLRKVFEVFEKYCTPIDMITTSEVAVSLTIDDTTNLQPILDELQGFGKVEVDRDQTIICIVGAQVAGNRGIVRKAFDSIDKVPIRMISFGGSKNNISILIDTKFKKPVLDRLNIGLFSIDLIE